MTSLNFLDLSWNKLGYSSSLIKYLCENLSTNTSLHHLDLSQNSIKKSEQNVFFTNLRNNHTLIGFHLTGNEICLDLDGNVHE